MSKIKTKELIICIITFIALVLSIVTDIFATDIEATLGGNSTGNNVQQIQERGNNTNNNTFNNTNNVLNKTNNTNNTANNTNKTAVMPNTGVDYSVLLIVAVCGISAIYAYKKISDYKNF